MRGTDEGDHLGVGAEVRVDRGIVGLPVAVVAGAQAVGGPVVLDPAVGELRGQPHRRDTEAVEIRKPRVQAGKVATVVEARVARIEPVDEPVAGEVATGVVARVAVVEPVGHHEVEHVVLGRLANRRPDEQLVARLGRTGPRVDRHLIGCSVVAERDRRAVGCGERDVVAGVALGPALVEGDLERVVAGRDQVRGERVDAVTVGVLQPGSQAVGLPVAGQPSSDWKSPAVVAITELTSSVTHLLLSSK